MNLRGLIQGGVDQAWSILGTDILDTITVTHYTRGAYVPGTGGVPTTQTSVTVKAARIDATLGLLAAQRDAGDQVQASRSYLVRAKDLPFDPVVGDMLSSGGVAMTILNVANHSNVVWELGLKA